MAEFLEVQTEDDATYKFFPVSSGSVYLKVRASNDAYIGLKADTKAADIVYVIIGGWSNTKSVIRRNTNQVAEFSSPDMLSKTEYRSFWIQWEGGKFSVSKERTEPPFLSWTDPEPFAINHIGVCTGQGATGSWQIEDGAEFDTPDKLEYVFRPVAAGVLDLEYRGPHNCHVCLSSGPLYSAPIYEVFLGGWENTTSVIRLNKQEKNEVVVKTPGLLDTNEFKKFLLEWRRGSVTVRDKATGMVIMHWVDPSPFPITHFGIRSGWGEPGRGAHGDWRIKHFKLQTGVWVALGGGQVPKEALDGGRDINGETLFVARARHEGALLPGKMVASHRCAYVPWQGKEYRKDEYEILLRAEGYKWLNVKGSNIPANAIRAGTSAGETLYVGRAIHKGNLTTGLVQPSQGVCYIPFNGQAIAYPEYDILTS